MSKPSTTTERLIRQVGEAEHSVNWFGHDTSRLCEALEQLVDADAIEALVCAVRFLFATSGRVRTTTRNTLTLIGLQVCPADLIRLSDIFRRYSEYYAPQGWDQLTPNHLATLAGSEHDPSYSVVLGLASFHRNGYVRQEAVQRLSTINDGTELPYLLIRQNDWVEPVALAAQAAVANRIRDEYLPYLVQSMRLILLLHIMRRNDLQPQVHRILRLIIQENHDECLRSLIESSDQVVRREVVGQALRIAGRHHRRVVEHALRSSDLIVRFIGCQHRFLASEDNPILAASERLMRDRAMPVRREVMLRVVEHSPEFAVSIWHRAMFDPHRSIRELAKCSLTQLGHKELAPIYREALAKSPDNLALMDGLSATGDETDVEFFRELLTHLLPSRRCAAIRGLQLAGIDEAIPHLLQSLRDPSPNVARRASQSLIPCRHAIPIRSLVEIIHGAEHLHTRAAAIDLLFRIGKWSSLSDLIQLTALHDKPTAQLAIDAIQRWYTSRASAHSGWLRQSGWTCARL